MEMAVTDTTRKHRVTHQVFQEILKVDDACTSCLGFQKEIFKSISSSQEYGYGTAEHKAEYGDILETAAKGCASCTVITEAIVALVTPSLPKDTKIVLGVFIKAYPGDQPSFFLVSFNSTNPVREKYSDHIELYSSLGQTVLQCAPYQ